MHLRNKTAELMVLLLLEFKQLLWQNLSLVVSLHHGGLMNGMTRLEERASLQGRLQ